MYQDGAFYALQRPFFTLLEGLTVGYFFPAGRQNFAYLVAKTKSKCSKNAICDFHDQNLGKTENSKIEEEFHRSF